mgnify:CR=1 FL=1
MIEDMLAEQEKMSPLRKAMGKLDETIGDCSRELHKKISDVWDEIDTIEGKANE